jgi:hypothetical protein
MYKREDKTAEGLVPDYVRRLAWLLDEAIPVTAKHRIGIDGFLNLVPVVGDGIGFALAGTVVLAGVRAGCSWITIVRMLGHAFGEALIGLVPGLGAIGAFFWKANSRNLRIIQHNLEDREATARESWKVILVAIGLVILLVLLVIAAFVIAVYTIWRWFTSR